MREVPHDGTLLPRPEPPDAGIFGMKRFDGRCRAVDRDAHLLQALDEAAQNVVEIFHPGRRRDEPIPQGNRLGQSLGIEGAGKRERVVVKAGKRRGKSHRAKVGFTG